MRRSRSPSAFHDLLMNACRPRHSDIAVTSVYRLALTSIDGNDGLAKWFRSWDNRTQWQQTLQLSSPLSMAQFGQGLEVWCESPSHSHISLLIELEQAVACSRPGRCVAGLQGHGNIHADKSVTKRVTQGNAILMLKLSTEIICASTVHLASYKRLETYAELPEVVGVCGTR